MEPVLLSYLTEAMGYAAAGVTPPKEERAIELPDELVEAVEAAAARHLPSQPLDGAGRLWRFSRCLFPASANEKGLCLTDRGAMPLGPALFLPSRWTKSDEPYSG